MTTTTIPTEGNPTVRIETVGGDLRIEGTDDHRIELRGKFREDAIRGENDSFVIPRSAEDLDVRLPKGATVIVYRVGGDVDVRDVAMLELATVGGDLEARAVAQLRIDAVGGDADLELEGAQVTISRVGGDLQVRRAEQLTVGIVGGDAELEQIGVLRGLEKVGGDLELEWSGRCEGDVAIKAGGDVRVQFGPEADLQLTATAPGDVSGHGPGWDVEGSKATLHVTFAAGSHQVRLRAGGDLEIEGGPVTNSSLESDRGPGAWHGEGSDPGMRGFPREMGAFAREMQALARDLARDLEGVGREVQREVMREVLRNVVSPESGRPGRPRVGVRVNGREFGFDAEQIERIKREAQTAAANGISRAQEAVMRALDNMNVPTPPRPGAPPQPPRPYTGQTVRIDRVPEQTPAAGTANSPSGAAAEKKPSNPDEERLAILRMVAAGQIAPSEAEVMLRSLERGA